MKKKRIIFSFFTIAILSNISIAQVTDTGNEVGIGVSNPSEKLDVNGAIRLGNGVGSWRFVTNSTGSFSIKETGYNGSINIYQSGINNVDLLNLSNGQVGIGVTAPSSRLHIADVSGAFNFGRPGTEMNNRFTIDAASGYENQIYFRSQPGRIFTGGKNLVLGNNSSSNSLVISGSNGYMGIGKSNPSERLDVEGAIRMGNGVGSWRFVTNSTEVFPLRKLVTMDQ